MTITSRETNFCSRTQGINEEGNHFIRDEKLNEAIKNLHDLESRAKEAKDIFGKDSIAYITTDGYYRNRKQEIKTYCEGL